jgi:hypothetical protein
MAGPMEASLVILQTEIASLPVNSPSTSTDPSRLSLSVLESPALWLEFGAYIKP